MFYSQYLLSSKGPLRNIWVAAFLHRKLRKIQVVETNICASIDEIILSKGPIALRLSAHLLLGVVRIYSKKVNYLFDDCNDSLNKLRNSFGSIRINPSEETRSARFHSITLPETFELDLFNLEIFGYQETECPSDHVKPQEQITLQEAWENNERDQYGTFSLIEDSHAEMPTHTMFASTSIATAEEVLPPLSMDIELGSNEIASTEKLRGHQLPPEEHVDHGISDMVEEPWHSEGDIIGIEDQDHSIGVEERDNHIVQTRLPEKYVEARTPAKTLEKPKMLAFLGDSTPEFMVLPTPAKQEQDRPTRKRKKLFDEPIILSNDVMRKRLNNTRSLLRGRRKAPDTALNVWKAYKISNMPQSFYEPSIPCVSVELKALFQENSRLVQAKLAECQPISKADQVERELPATYFTDSRMDEDQSAIIDSRNTDNECLFDKLHETDAESSCHGGADGQSVRTRSVSRYLQKSFQTPQGILNLSRILEGRTRAGCARFFMETLVLKSLGYIGVKQDTPYGDILLLETAQLKEAML